MKDPMCPICNSKEVVYCEGKKYCNRCTSCGLVFAEI